MFDMTAHLVIVVEPRKHATGISGRWRCSEPLAMGQTIEGAIERIKKACGHSYETCEIIHGDSGPAGYHVCRFPSIESAVGYFTHQDSFADDEAKKAMTEWVTTHIGRGAIEIDPDMNASN